MGLWDFAVSKQNLAELEDVLWWLPAPTKLKLIGLHLIQTCRNTVPVTSRHSGFEDFAGTSGSLHNGSLSQWELWQGLPGVGRACFESGPLVLTLLCVSVRKAGQTCLKNGERCYAALTDVGPFYTRRPAPS